MSIDVHKDEIEKLKDLYKALLHIAEIIHENEIIMEMGSESLDKAVSVLQNARTTDTALAEQYKEINEYGFSWLKSVREEYHAKDFGDIFEKYINN